MAERETTLMQGRVEQLNDGGFKLNGTWINYGKYYKEEWPKAKIGDSVEAATTQSNGRYYMGKPLVIKGAPQPQNGHSAGPSATPTTRDLTITRLAVLKDAVAFHAGTTATVQDIMATANLFFSWALDEEPEPEDEPVPVTSRASEVDLESIPF